MAVGANYEDSLAVGINGDQDKDDPENNGVMNSGAVYLY